MTIRKLSFLMIGGVFSFVFLYASLLLYLTWPISELSIDKSGVFGDSFGLLTSLFSGLAFAGLIITIVMQRDELALQREELGLVKEELRGQKQEMQAQNDTLKTQQFENTFFKMLDVLHQCRADIKAKDRLHNFFDGREGIEVLYNEFIYGYMASRVEKFRAKSKADNYTMDSDCLNKEVISNRYHAFYSDYGAELGQYFRVLYHILRFVDDAGFLENKTTYSNILRAQISRYELLLLFYNCLSVHGSGLGLLAKKYGIFKHLEVDRLPEEHGLLWESVSAKTL